MRDRTGRPSVADLPEDCRAVTNSMRDAHASKVGGAMRDRTADLLRARQALSQLSYSPK